MADVFIMSIATYDELSNVMSNLALFPFGHLVASASSGGILDRTIEAEDKKHGDLLRLVLPFCLASISYLPHLSDPITTIWTVYHLTTLTISHSKALLHPHGTLTHSAAALSSYMLIKRKELISHNLLC